MQSQLSEAALPKVSARARDSSASKALLLLFVVSLLNYIDRSLLSVLQVPIKRELALSDLQLGALTGLSFALFYATAAVPIALLVDRWRRTWLMGIALIVWTIMTALSGLANSFIALLLFRIGVALGEAGSVPATHSLLSDYFPLRWRGRVFSVWAVASPLGTMIGIWGAGVLSERFGWRATFAIIGGLGLLVAPLLFLLSEPPRGRFDVVVAKVAQAPQAPGRTITLWESLRLLLHIRSLRVLIVATSLHSFTYTAILNWTPPFLSRVHHLPLGDVAMWSSLVIGVGGGLGALCGGAMVDLLATRDRRWYGWAPALASCSLIPAALLQFFSASLPTSLAWGFATILLAGFFIAPVNALAQSLVSPRVRGLTAAVLLIVPTIFGLGLGPIATGAASDFIASRYNSADLALRYALSLSLCGSLLAAVLFLRMSTSLRQDLPSTTPTQK